MLPIADINNRHQFNESLAEKNGKSVTVMNIKDFARSPLGLLVLVLGISLAVFSLANLYFTPVQVK